MLKDYQKICQILKYDFKNPKLLEQALTHCSKEAGYSYECLEFLGDSVLGFLVSAYLYHTYPNANEGTLTSFRMHLVREEYLASWARKKGLGSFIVLGKGEENSGGREKSSILCDITESIIGAVYLDGGIGEAEKLVTRIISSKCVSAPDTDAKTALQIFIQKDPKNVFSYEVYKSEGPPHDTTFFVHAILNGEVIADGTGKSKKNAEQEAAKTALLVLRERYKTEKQ